MLFIKFFVHRRWDKLVTGGQKYDYLLYSVLKSIPGIRVEETEIGGNKKGSPLLKPFYELSQGLKNRKADIIIFNSSKCLRFIFLLIFLKITAPITDIYSIHHHFIYLEFSGLKRFIYRTAEWLFLKLSDKIIVPSPYIYEKLKKIKKEKDLLLWRIPFETKAEFGVRPIPGNLTFAGTIEPRKGLIYLFEALNQLQNDKINYNLNILGKVINENYYKQLKEYAEKHNLKVNFLGFLETTEKDRILSESDIFVFPSLLEGFGMVLVEAQVYGLPIVCFDNSAMPFSVKDGVNGYVVKNKDYVAFSNKIADIVTDRTLRERLSQGAYDNLKSQWSVSQYKETVTRYFKKMVSARKKN